MSARLWRREHLLNSGASSSPITFPPAKFLRRASIRVKRIPHLIQPMIEERSILAIDRVALGHWDKGDVMIRMRTFSRFAVIQVMVPPTGVGTHDAKINGCT